MHCVKILSQAINSEELQDVSFDSNLSALPELIPKFFHVQDRGMFRIAIVCGEHEKWTAEKFAQQLNDIGNKATVCIYSLGQDIQPQFGGTAPHIFVATVSAGAETDNVTHIFSLFYSEIHRILLQVKEIVVSTASDRMLGESFDKAIRMTGDLSYWVEEDSNLVNNNSENLAKKLTDYLEAVTATNEVPPVHVLAFLPKAAFKTFDDNKGAFFRQIEYVLLFEDIKNENIRLKETVNSLLAQVHALQAEKADYRINHAKFNGQIEAVIQQATMVEMMADRLDNTSSENALAIEQLKKSLKYSQEMLNVVHYHITDQDQVNRDLQLPILVITKDGQFDLESIMQDPSYNMRLISIDIEKYDQRPFKRFPQSKESAPPSKVEYTQSNKSTKDAFGNSKDPLDAMEIAIEDNQDNPHITNER